MNLFVLTGKVRTVHIPDKEDPSALILLQYGPERERHGNRPVEFINAVPVRIPSFRLQKIRDQLVEGVRLEVHGRLQGVLKGIMTDGYITTELVAERVFVAEDFADDEPAAAAAEPKTK